MSREGLYSGQIIAASQTEPSPPADLYYTIRIRVQGQDAEFENIRPSESRRGVRLFSSINLIPFQVGEKVVVHLTVAGQEELLSIETGERPEIGECA